jgi:uncharacterized membrane protein
VGSNFNDWLQLLLRWFHLIAGIYWIGHSFYFMWLDSNLEKAKGQGDNVTGELWMIHSGGYYQVLKHKITPGGLPELLHWFKWEAALTWLSGICLLSLVFYMSGGIYLLDSEISEISNGGAIGLGIGLLVVGWFVYDFLFKSSLAAKQPKIVTAISLVLLLGIIYALTHVISGRAAYIHVGALFGTLMVGNVWLCIIPCQKMMVNAAEAGKEIDHSLGERAKTRSVHNNYMTFPLLFIMLSNHYPGTYGHEYNWLMLIGLILFGASIRHFMNTSKRIALLPALVLLALMFTMTLPPSVPEPDAVANNGAAPDKVTDTNVKKPDPKVEAGKNGEENGEIKPVPKAVDQGKPAQIHGIVTFEGSAPAPKTLSLPAKCQLHHKGRPVVKTPIMVQNGRLQNVLVYIKRGIKKKRKFPKPGRATLDQKGCIFNPHILAVQVNQEVVMANSDTIFHNVKLIAIKNQRFNEGIPAKGSVIKSFAKTEIGMRMKCDVHPWMQSYIAVLPNPYFVVTDSKAEFTFKDLRAGTYTLMAWHATLGEVRKKIKIKGGAVGELVFTFKK